MTRVLLCVGKTELGALLLELFEKIVVLMLVCGDCVETLPPLLLLEVLLAPLLARLPKVPGGRRELRLDVRAMEGLV